MSQRDLSGRLARWSLKLQALDFQIGYRKGSLNTVPDTLSRAFSEESPHKSEGSLERKVDSLITPPGECSLTPFLPKISNISHLVDSLNEDDSILHVDLNSPCFQDEEYVEQINKIRNLKNVETNYRVSEDKLLIAPSYGSRYLDTDLPVWKLVIPKSLTRNLIEQAHAHPTSAHLGSSKTTERLQRQFYWPGLATQVKQFIASCQECKMNKSVNFITRPAMGLPAESFRPFQRLYVDFLGPYPRSKRGMCYILIVLDHFSKFVIVKPLREASASSLCSFLENDVFLMFSVPEIVTSDNGKQFISKLFQDLMTKYGISHIRTPVYSPQSNASERVNRTLLAGLRAYLDDQSHNEWDAHLYEVVAALRNAVHNSTKFSPHYVVFGQHMSLHGSEYGLRKLLSNDDANEVYIRSKPDRLNATRETILHYLKVAHNKASQYYNLRSKVRSFSPGQPVFVRSFALSDASAKFSAKLAAKFLPAIVESRVGNVAYKLKNLEGKPLGTYHTKDIRT